MHLSAICFVSALFVAAVVVDGIPWMRSKRSTNEQLLDDPEKCIEKCTLNQPDLPNATEYENPFVQMCFFTTHGRECLGKCPDSKAKTLLLDSSEPLAKSCQASPAEIAKAVDCVYNNTEELFSTCIPKCREQNDLWDVAPEVMPDFEAEDARNAVVVIAATDADTVNKNLTILCSQESCMISCFREPLTARCGQSIADEATRNYGLWVKSLSKIYIDLGVISAAPAECDKVPA